MTVKFLLLLVPVAKDDDGMYILQDRHGMLQFSPHHRYLQISFKVADGIYRELFHGRT